MTGTIKRLVKDKGFGFIKDDVSGQEFFFHRSSVKDDGFESLSEGQRATFEQENSPKGPRAGSVEPA